ALQAEGGNRVAAARRLDISRSYLHRLITELGLNASEEERGKRVKGKDESEGEDKDQDKK
ncbi:MAG: hypothetical protein M3444_02730, partial [Acidobacteriota bacterium]|nr:hypothetical protein [Acidobacteriota bacterium]